MYEIAALLHKLKVHSVMTKDVLSIDVDTPLEDAARIMADNNIGGLPVMEEDILVGIITESDLFKIFIELFGARETGIRLTLLMPDSHGELAAVSSAIANAGGDIVSFGNMLGENATNRYGIFKVRNLSEQELIGCVEPLVTKIVDIREM